MQTKNLTKINHFSVKFRIGKVRFKVWGWKILEWIIRHHDWLMRKNLYTRLSKNTETVTFSPW